MAMVGVVYQLPEGELAAQVGWLDPQLLSRFRVTIPKNIIPMDAIRQEAIPMIDGHCPMPKKYTNNAKYANCNANTSPDPDRIYPS